MWQLYSALLLVPSELFLSIHSQTSEGWTAELAVGLWLVVPAMGFKPIHAYIHRFIHPYIHIYIHEYIHYLF